MNNASGVWKFLGVAALVTVASLAGGYYLSSGPSKPLATPSNNSQTTSDAVTPTTTTPPTVISPAQAGPASSEYTAPDAPSIDIKEVKPRIGPKKADKPVDSEASEADAAQNTDNTAKQDTLIQTPSSTDTPSSVTDTPTPSLMPPAPPVASTPVTSAPELSLPPSQAANPAPDHIATGPIYHVIVGNLFADEKNARIFAASLRQRGYMAVTEAINSGGSSVYKVQVGAYRNRITAEDQVSQLQQSGYKAFIADR